ncbi:hypothetical protein GCM10018962_50670 [Dactylosporangium matsuzakiense]|uniref:Uncharacterized protein n=1 Tax=Dactylosporangium matsuzakiense TaxID=53360 RepID=A0A9W6NMV7_9ACTN|nr:hypothetical protein GCM10017581_040940 [Dactylosporangium matsuzakiense]
MAIAFASVPWITCGLLTPAAFGFAAILRRSWLFAAAAVAYLVTTTGTWVLEDPDPRYGWCRQVGSGEWERRLRPWRPG